MCKDVFWRKIEDLKNIDNNIVLQYGTVEQSLELWTKLEVQ